MTRNSFLPSAALPVSDEEKKDIQVLIEEFGTHINLDRINQAFLANESSLTESDYQGLLAINLFRVLAEAQRSPELISSDEKTWIFQVMGYLKMDPKKVLADARFFFLRR
jgi:hypothetical protein